MEAWASFGGHHLHHSPSHGKATLKTINRGSYLPTQTPTSTSKIVDQALNVVKSHVACVKKQLEHKNLESLSLHEPRPEQDELPPSLMASETSLCSSDNSAASVATDVSAREHSSPSPVDAVADCPEPEDGNVIPPSLRKIAKKRRKENDEGGFDRSSFHHTKSSKEYLRKAQEALIIRGQLERSEQSDDSRGPHVPLAKEVAERLLSSAPSVFARQGPVRSSLHNPTRNQPAPEANESSPLAPSSVGLSRSQSCDYLETRMSPSAGNDTSCPYGYEDPDAEAAENPTRRMGMARRRGSVTKFSLKAAEHAKAATERIMKLQGLKCKSPERRPERRSATPTGRRRHPRRSIGMTTGGRREDSSCEALPVDVQDLQHHSNNTEASEYGSDLASTTGDRFSTASSNSNPYGYEDPDAGFKSQTTTSTNDLYGYEDPDACTKKTDSSPYGYENTDSQPQQPRRRHPRPTRRGSVTKFSLDAATIVATASKSANESAESVHEKPDGFSTGHAADRETEDDLVRDFKASNHGGLDSFLSARSPYFVSSQLQQSDVNRAFTINGDVTDSDNGLSRGILSSRHGVSPRRTGSQRRPNRFSAESLRSDSFMSHGSGVSLDDDADSLAPDMESLCSIHDRFEDNDFAPLPPPRPERSPLTPRKTPNRSRSGSSLRGTYSLTRPAYSNGSINSEGFQLKPKRASLGRAGTTVTVPLDGDFAILPLVAPTSPIASTGESLMPAPVKRNPSNSSTAASVNRTSSNSSGRVPFSIHAAVTCPTTEVAVAATLGRRAPLAT
jgi:hypothetical protein